MATGLTAFAVSFGTGRLVPELSKGAERPFEAIGVALERAVGRGECVPLSDATATVLTLAGALLGVATILLVLVHPR